MKHGLNTDKNKNTKENMSKRIKVPIDTVISRDEAEALVTDIANCENNRRKLQAQLDQEKLELESRYAASFELLDEQVQQNRDALKGWADQNPQLFEKKKSYDFACGTVGFRTGMPALKPLNKNWNMDKALQATMQHLPNFIIGKPVIDSAGLIAQREDPDIIAQLPKCGLRIVQQETFYVDPKLADTDARVSVTTEAK